MRPIFLAFALCASVLGFAQTAPDSSTPEKTVQSFWAAWNAHDGKAMLGLLDAVQPVPDHDKMIAKMSEATFAAAASDYELVQGSGEAVVIYHLVLTGGGVKVTDQEDMVRVRQTPEGWRIVRAKGTTAPTTYGLGALAAYLQGPEFLETAKVMINDCAQNIRQLGLALIMMTGDYDDVIQSAPSQAAIRKAIAPYLKSEKMWECAGHAGTAFSFNVKLAGKNMTTFEDPANTVLLYEGEKGNLDFRHDGRAWVCFADGHVKAVSKEEAATLLWTATKKG